jgi:hypothetical protein
MPFDFSQNWQITASTQFGDFDEVSGGEDDINITDYVPGGARRALKIQGTGSYTDVTISRAYAPDRDASIIDWFNLNKVGLAPPMTVTKRVVNHQGILVDTIIYRQCKAKSLKTPDGKAGDNSMAMIALTLSVED